MKKRLLAATFSVAMLYPTTAFGAFHDVSEGYEEAVMYLAEHGVINGYADDTFRPEQTITRVQAARMFTRQLQPNSVVNDVAFTDVLPTHSDYDAIMQVTSLGILNGQQSGATKVFKPGHALTRAQLAKAFVEAYDLQLPAKHKAAKFEDVPETAWYKPYVDILVAHGLMNGYSKKEFAPNEPVKRKHFASIYYRYLTSDAAQNVEPYIFGKALHAKTNEPLAQATVSIFDGEELYMQVTTDATGAYRAELPAGRYTMQVEKGGFIEEAFTIDASATERVKQMIFLQAEQPTQTVSNNTYVIDTWGLSFALPEVITNYALTFPTMTELHIEKNDELLVSIHVYRNGDTPSFRGAWDVLRENYKGYDYYIKHGGNPFSGESTAEQDELFDTIFKTAEFR